MGVDKEYIIEHCRDKQRSYGIDICMIQTEPCKRAVEMDRCPKLWEFYRMSGSEKPNNCGARMTDSEKPNNCEPQKSCSTCGYSTLTPSCDTCEGYSNWWSLEDVPTGYNLSPVEDEPQTERSE